MLRLDSRTAVLTAARLGTCGGTTFAALGWGGGDIFYSRWVHSVRHFIGKKRVSFGCISILTKWAI